MQRGLRSAAAGLEPALSRGGGEVDLSLSGRPDPGARSPVGLLAWAATELAAGHQARSRQLTRQAAQENAAHPTYYG